MTAPTNLIRRQRDDIARLRAELKRRERAGKGQQRQRDNLQREIDGLKRENDHLKQQFAAARRAGRRQVAPFAKDRPQGRGGVPGGVRVRTTAVTVAARARRRSTRRTRRRSRRRVRTAAARLRAATWRPSIRKSSRGSNRSFGTLRSRWATARSVSPRSAVASATCRVRSHARRRYDSEPVIPYSLECRGWPRHTEASLSLGIFRNGEVEGVEHVLPRTNLKFWLTRASWAKLIPSWTTSRPIRVARTERSRHHVQVVGALDAVDRPRFAHTEGPAVGVRAVVDDAGVVALARRHQEPVVGTTDTRGVDRQALDARRQVSALRSATPIRSTATRSSGGAPGSAP